MNERANPESANDAPAAEQRGCEMPMSRDVESGEFLYCDYHLDAARQGGGRPRKYCGRTVLGDDGVHRKHDRINAFQRTRELERGSGPVRREKTEDRPVSTAKMSFEDLLTRFEMVTSSHRDQLEAIVGEARRIVETASDPDAAVYEVTKIAEANETQTRAAQAAATAAQHEAQIARRERDRALEDKTLAEGAAEDALTDRDEKVTAAQELASAASAEAQSARDDADTARTERDQVKNEAADKVTAALAERDTAIAKADRDIRQARTDAEAQIAQAGKDAERQVADAKAANDQEVARIRTEAADKVTAASTAQAVAENARDAADRDAAGAHADATAARAELAEYRRQAHADIERARAETAAARAQFDTDTRDLRNELTIRDKVAKDDRTLLVTQHAAALKQTREDFEARILDLKAALAALTTGATPPTA